MRKIGLCLILAAVLVIPMSSNCLAEICIDISTACNDYYVGFAPAGRDVYGLHGEEYGCGFDDRPVFGAMHIAGGYAYISLSGSNVGTIGDYTHLMSRIITVNLATYTGSYEYDYLYTVSGVGDGHGGTGSCSVTMCSSPPLAASANALDEAE